MPSLSATLGQIQKIGKIDSYLIMNSLKKKSFSAQNTHSKLSKNFLTYSVMSCFTEVNIFSFEAAME